MSNPASHPLVVTIADDLTGALDSGVEFAKHGLATYVATSPDHLDEALAQAPTCLVINTASREIAAAQAQQIHDRLRQKLDHLEDHYLFKKVDSRLKGNIAAEINGLIGPQQKQVILAPAIPAMGRLHQAGILTGSGIETPINIAERCSDLSQPVHVPDIANQTDFNTILQTAPGQALFVGAKGMAQALAQTLVQTLVQTPAPHQTDDIPAKPSTKQTFKPLAGTMLAAIGSRDPITLRQIDSLSARQLAAVRHVAVPDGDISEKITEKDTSLLLQLTAGPNPQDSIRVGAKFTAVASEIFKRHQYDNLIACGGQTAQDLLQTLSVRLLKLTGELYPGVPVAEALFDSRRFWLITKSGGFGDPDLLANLFARQSEPPQA
ncbi:four-carbon acid sugar kinase family protein [Cohaesibacter intestini]|uniref:four-carbon acid sugar kinase family protein n=1 Tax=Cohaesibacter intestini TaxID=2211145 RepID=UPI000DEB36F4|nr:four-carbon acid sugar kinase family protein [Cohaesibacter intestini]